MTVKLLAKQHLEFLSLKGGCTGSSESTLVKMPHCWKSRVVAQMENVMVFLLIFMKNKTTFHVNILLTDYCMKYQVRGGNTKTIMISTSNNNYVKNIMIIKVKKNAIMQDQESIQSITTPDPGHHMGK